MRFLIAIALLAAPLAASAITFTLAGGPPPQLVLQVGSAGATINEVQFNVPPESLGNTGTQVPGDQPVYVYAHMRAFPNPRPQALVNADSSTPLSGSAGTIPMTEICWKSSEGNEIPDGCFDGSAAQTLATVQNQTGFYLTLQFYYANTQPVVAGTYTGRVTYTMFAP